MQKKYIQTFILGLVLLMPVAAFASPVVRTGESVIIENDKSVQGNLYGAAGVVNISGKVDGDAYLAGGTVTVNVSIKKDLSVAGGTVRVLRGSGDDIRIVGGDVSVSGVVNGDLVVLGGTVRILSDTEVKGDVIIYGGDVVVEGVVHGALYGGGEMVKLNAKIDGTVELTRVESLTFGDALVIKSGVTYTSPREVVQNGGAQITGEVKRVAAENADEFNWFFAIVFFGSILCLASIMQILYGKRIVDVVARTLKNAGVNALTGAGVILVVPIACAILGVTLVGIPVAMFAFSFYVSLIIASFALLAILVGSLMYRGFVKSITVSWFTTIIGSAIVVFILSFIAPLVFILLFVPVGALARDMYQFLSGKVWKKK